MDTRVSPPGLDKLPEQVERHLGGLNDDWLLAADLIVASPGMALAHPSLSAAADAGVEIVGDIELFCREAQAPVIAITGSNGKSTVTTLVGEMAKAAGMNVGVGGNIGLPALMLLDKGCELYVSSFPASSWKRPPAFVRPRRRSLTLLKIIWIAIRLVCSSTAPPNCAFMKMRRSASSTRMTP